jgi:hypothetical protein
LLKRILGAMLINIDDIEVIEAHSRRMDGWLKFLTRISAQGCILILYFKIVRWASCHWCIERCVKTDSVMWEALVLGVIINIHMLNPMGCSSKMLLMLLKHRNDPRSTWGQVIAVLTSETVAHIARWSRVVLNCYECCQRLLAEADRTFKYYRCKLLLICLLTL